MATQVVNKHHNVPHDIYIGRGSIWGNPYRLTETTTPEDVLIQYETHLIRSGLINEIHRLRDKRLQCFCAPKLCHGHILAWYADHDGNPAHTAATELGLV